MSIKVTELGAPAGIPHERLSVWGVGITVVIPTIRPRYALLRRALDSVAAQTRRPSAVVVVEDIAKDGAAATRHRGLAMSRTEYTAFLDDDDEMLPNHLETLHTTAIEHGAGYVWSRFQTAVPHPRNTANDFGYQNEYVYEQGPKPLGRGTFEQWNDAQPAQTTVTTLVNTARALDVGGFLPSTTCSCDCSVPTGHQDGCRLDLIDGQRAGEDWDFTLRMRAAGVVFRHAPHVTWNWHHHGRNTSGLPNNW